MGFGGAVGEKGEGDGVGSKAMGSGMACGLPSLERLICVSDTYHKTQLGNGA